MHCEALPECRKRQQRTPVPHTNKQTCPTTGCCRRQKAAVHSLTHLLPRSLARPLTPSPLDHQAASRPAKKWASRERRKKQRKQHREEGERKRKCHPSTQPRVRNRFGSKVVTSWWLQPCWAECRWRRCCVQRTRRGRTLGRVQSGGGMLGRHALAVLGDLGSSSSPMFDQPLVAITSLWRQEFLFHHS